ncbi:hypothetical protein RJT34_24470 [Clitoria ternatea]|uniref:Uncharacterized protein n=1 Tax=Clitoria ternatea TaxID=43366 RepID=A0AAN9FUS3_CLITE
MGKPILVLFLFCLISPSTGDIKTITLTSDTRPMILFEKFGFTDLGHVSIAVSSVSVVADSWRLGFFLLNEESLLQVLIEIQQSPTFCVLDSHYINRLFTFRDLSPPPMASFNRTYPVTLPNEYSLFFANCAPESSVSMIIHTELYNTDSNGFHNHLSVGQTPLPYLSFLFSITYFAFYIFFCYSTKCSLRLIHFFVASFLFVMALSLLCVAVDKYNIMVTGTPIPFLDLPFFVLQFIPVVLLFTIIILVGINWSFFKPKIGYPVLGIVILLQVVVNVGYIVNKTGPDWVTWNQVFCLVDIFSCCAVIFLMVWSIRAFNEETHTDYLEKLTRFTRFFMVVTGYLLFTRLVLFGFQMVVGYKYEWVTNLAQEIATLTFCVVMFYMFTTANDVYFAVVDEEEEVAIKIVAQEEQQYI